MNRIPRPVRRALESLASSPINASALAMAEGKDFAGGPCSNPWPFTSRWPWNSASKKEDRNGVTSSWTTSSYRVTRQDI